MRGALCFRRARDQIGHAVHRRLQNIADQIGDPRIARGLGVKIDNERRDHLRRIFATMRGEQNLKRLEQRRRLLRALEDLVMHAGLMEASFGEADQGSIKNLGVPI